jgi:hypothetical protein
MAEDEAERDWIRTRLEPLVGLGGEATAAADREESFAAWRGFLEAIAMQGPFVLVIEDLHWADPALLAFLEHLADWASGVPLLILCTARPELYERHPAWGGGTRNHTTGGAGGQARGGRRVDRADRQRPRGAARPSLRAGDRAVAIRGTGRRRSRGEAGAAADHGRRPVAPVDTATSFAFFDRAFELTRPGELERLRVLFLGTRLLTWGGEAARDRRSIADDALDEARGQGDRLAEGEVLSALSRLAWHAGDTARQLELIERAISILEDLPPGRELARALTRRASAYGLSGRTAETMRAVEGALPVVVRAFGSEADLAVLLQFRGEARVFHGEVADGIDDLREGSASPSSSRRPSRPAPPT